jgi:processive 1,2-diacylglycerol beta-glucosyltransferase
MRVLILSVTTGQGHNQVAKNMGSFLEECGAETLTLDVFEYINPVLKEIVSRGYLMSTKRLPKVYGKAYRMAEKRDTENKDSKVIRITSSTISRKPEKLINEYMPDVIVCTHVFAAMLVSSIERRQNSKIKTVGIVTDFTVHPYWEETDLDYYITATSLLTNQALKKGISQDKICPIGIPIDPKFAFKIPKEEARQILGIENMQTVLVMSGSMGYGKLGRMIRQLDETMADFQIISVCGHNQKLKKQIDKMKLKHKIYNFGFTDKVDLLMDAADCIVTKPGGLTTSEALAKGLPIIMANPIPGQEDRNVEFLLNNGAAVRVSSTYPVDEALYQIFTNHDRQESMIKMVNSLGKPDSAKQFARFILKVCGEGGKEI